jgi:hypothetical protein
MTPQKGTKAHKAYEKGKEAAILNLGKNANPYVIGSVISLSNWWIKWYNDGFHKVNLTEKQNDRPREIETNI